MNEIDLPQLATLIAILATGVGLVATIYGFGQKMGQLTLKVNILWERNKAAWDFIANRNMLDALGNNIVRMESPLNISDEFKAQVEATLPDLPEWYGEFLKANPNYDSAEFFSTVIAKFGTRIMQEIGLPKGLAAAGTTTGLQVYCERYLKPASLNSK